MRPKPLLMGVLNVTPDSFSDGGEFVQTDIAVNRALEMVEQGADVIDVGGESTRPGAASVSEEEELRRVIPVISRLSAQSVRVSIDTSKPAVARAALEAGAETVNDVTGLSDPAMLDLCVAERCSVCIMHMQGEPRTMQSAPAYGDVVQEVLSFLLDRANQAEASGLPKEKIWIDPGIGFGKTVDHNLRLLNNLAVFVESGYPVLIGVSRKSFIGKIAGAENPKGRIGGSIAAQVLAQAVGIAAIRAHDIREARQAIDVADAILRA